MAEHVKSIEPTLDWDCVWGECNHEGECPTVDRAVCLGCSDQEPDADGYVTLQEWAKAIELGHPGPAATSSDVRPGGDRG